MCPQPAHYVYGCMIREDIKIPHSKISKTCWGNIGNLFVICMRQVTIGHLYHLLGVSNYYVMIGRGQSKFCETSAKVTSWVTDPFRWLCELL